MGDLFGFEAGITAETFSATYASGGSAYWDAKGIIASGKSLGVVAGELRARTIGLIREFARAGGRTFIDSGAFGVFMKGHAIDFDAVFAVYDTVLDELPEAARRNIAIVMPDVIGDQRQTLALLEQHRAKVLHYVALGADVIIPLQRGELPACDAAEHVITMLGTHDIRFGIPSKAAAMSFEEAVKVRHHRFHILGKVSMDTAMQRLTYWLLQTNPGADLTCDANMIRSRLARISGEQKRLVEDEEDPFSAVFDDTELLDAIWGTPAWLTQREVEAIAALYGVTDPITARRWVREHASNGLAAVLEDVDPEGTLLWTRLSHVFDAAATKELSARLRAKAVEWALAA